MVITVLEARPLAPVETTPTFSFEGCAIAFRPGQTVAAALIAAGEVVLRRAENGEARGALCCIGVCGAGPAGMAAAISVVEVGAISCSSTR